MKRCTSTRLAGGVLLGSRRAAAAFAGRHVSQVRRHCAPVACDVRTRADLYDLDAVTARLGGLPRRGHRRAA